MNAMGLSCLTRLCYGHYLSLNCPFVCDGSILMGPFAICFVHFMDIEFKDQSTLNAPVHIVDYKLCSMDFMDYKLQIKIFILLG